MTYIFITLLSLLLCSITIINAEYPYTLDIPTHAPKMTAEYREYERQGKVEGIGVRFFPNTPEPTEPRTKQLLHYQNNNKSKLPTEWDWRMHAPLHSNSLTQRAPQWCGCCYAMAALSSLTDRFLITYPKQFPNTILSVQEILNCGSETGFGYVGCVGSQWERVFAYVQKYGVVDQTCNPYLGVERSFTVYPSDCYSNQCRQCTSDGTCQIVKKHKKWGITDWGLVSGEEDMKNEIFNRGPISCYIQTHVPTYVNYLGGIMSDPTKFEPYDITHVVSLIGFGEDDNGTPYWIARNWVGPNWGEDGFFRIYRGNNTMNIEWKCGYANPNPDFIPPTPSYE